jgi:hypothetical protein
MAVHEEVWRPATGPVALTDGERQVTCDTPADFADWLAGPGSGVDLARWWWTKP